MERYTLIHMLTMLVGQYTKIPNYKKGANTRPLAIYMTFKSMDLLDTLCR